MEFSPLRFLDFDSSQMLTASVRLSQEEEARRFHCNINHPTPSIITKVFSYNIRRFWGDFWDNVLSCSPPSQVSNISSFCQRRIKIYEQEVLNITAAENSILNLYA
tara:strand:+ start:288 stop:605 length:318 start_codon:yes stop_codon:yes gene_type:complete